MPELDWSRVPIEKIPPRNTGASEASEDMPQAVPQKGEPLAQCASGGEALLDRVLDCGERRRQRHSSLVMPSVVCRRPAVVKAHEVKHFIKNWRKAPTFLQLRAHTRAIVLLFSF